MPAKTPDDTAPCRAREIDKNVTAMTILQPEYASPRQKIPLKTKSEREVLPSI